MLSAYAACRLPSACGGCGGGALSASHDFRCPFCRASQVCALRRSPAAQRLRFSLGLTAARGPLRVRSTKLPSGRFRRNERDTVPDDHDRTRCRVITAGGACCMQLQANGQRHTSPVHYTARRSPPFAQCGRAFASAPSADRNPESQREGWPCPPPEDTLDVTSSPTRAAPTRCSAPTHHGLQGGRRPAHNLRIRTDAPVSGYRPRWDPGTRARRTATSSPRLSSCSNARRRARRCCRSPRLLAHARLPQNVAANEDCTVQSARQSVVGNTHIT